jgi:ketosteroid isomerase-like protein
MMKVALVALLVAVAASGGSGKEKPKGPLTQAVEAERAFAKMSLDRNHREAFLAYFADDASLMRPGRVNAKKWIEENPKWGTAGLLTWDPSFAACSTIGDMVYTTGPWEYRETRSLDAKPVAFGYFCTIWRKTLSGDWKVEFDHGTSNPAPAAPVEPFKVNHDPIVIEVGLFQDEPTRRATIEKADAEFVKALAEKGAQKAYEAALADDARLHRDGAYPVLGKKRIVAAVAAEPAGLAFTQQGAGVSAVGDLGYAFGTVSRPGAEPGAYFRVWRWLDGHYRLVLDVMNPPAAPKQG